MCVSLPSVSWTQELQNHDNLITTIGTKWQVDKNIDNMDTMDKGIIHDLKGQNGKIFYHATKNGMSIKVAIDKIIYCIYWKNEKDLKYVYQKEMINIYLFLSEHYTMCTCIEISHGTLKISIIFVSLKNNNVQFKNYEIFMEFFQLIYLNWG